MTSQVRRPWIGVDLDGTLAHYEKWLGWITIGPAIPRMLARVKEWLVEGKEVRIFTARVAPEEDVCWITGQRFTRQEIVEAVHLWCEANGLPRLPVTHEKDAQMIELWDDRCVQVVPNTGMTLREYEELNRA